MSIIDGEVVVFNRKKVDLVYDLQAMGFKGVQGVSFDSASLLFIGHLFLIIIDIFLYLCLFGWSIWNHMVQIF
jgi:hypothetical protein